MTRRIALYAAVGIVAFGIGLVTYLPASLVAGWVAGDTPARLAGVSGTMLDGEAAYASLPHGALDDVHWHVHPAALLLGRLSATVRADSDLGPISGEIQRGLFGDNRLDNVQGEATIGWVADLGGYTFVPVSGRIELHLAHVAFNDDLQISALEGQVDLTRTRWQLLNPPLELGQFKAHLDRSDDENRLRIIDSQGPLALTGGVAVSDSQRYTLDTHLRARSGADSRLQQILKQLGRPDSQGWYHVKERGSL